MAFLVVLCCTAMKMEAIGAETWNIRPITKTIAMQAIKNNHSHVFLKIQ